LVLASALIARALAHCLHALNIDELVAAQIVTASWSKPTWTNIRLIDSPTNQPARPDDR
jgi:hypothetical protein